MREWDCIVVRAGRPQEMPLDHLQFVTLKYPRDFPFVELFLAFRWLCLGQRVSFQVKRLQFRNLVPKLHCVYRRCIGISYCLRTIRCDQDTHSKSQFRQSQERVYDCRKHDEERGYHQFFQRTDSKTTDDRTEVGI